jgi:hypothetical protein
MLWFTRALLLVVTAWSRFVLDHPCWVDDSDDDQTLLAVAGFAGEIRMFADCLMAMGRLYESDS